MWKRSSECSGSGTCLLYQPKPRPCAEHLSGSYSHCQVRKVVTDDFPILSLEPAAGERTAPVQFFPLQQGRASHQNSPASPRPGSSRNFSAHCRARAARQPAYVRIWASGGGLLNWGTGAINSIFARMRWAVLVILASEVCGLPAASEIDWPVVKLVRV